MAETVPGWDEVASAAVLQSLGSLFERRGDGWAPFHKSVRDWLTDRDTKARHRVAETAGRSRLASLLWRHFVTAAVDPAASLSPFLLREFPAQAARQTRATRAAWVMEASNWNPLQARCVATIIFFRERRFWAAMLAWCGLSDLLAHEAEEPGWWLRMWAAVERGDVLRLLGRTAEASDAYRSNLKLCPAPRRCRTRQSGVAAGTVRGPEPDRRHFAGTGEPDRGRRGLSFWYRKNWEGGRRPPGTAGLAARSLHQP